MQERRSEQRFMCSELVRVVVQNPDVTDVPDQEAVATLEDTSPSGACVQLEAAVAEGADIEIVCSTCRLKGRVRYCRFVQIGYDAGIQFDQPGAWNRDRFEPEHLLAIPVRVPRRQRRRRISAA